MPDPAIPSIISQLQSGNAVAAEQMARQALVTQPEDVQLMTLLAIALSFLGRASEAAELYRKLAELAPDDPAHRSNLGTALRDSGDLVGAEQAYREALALRPREPVTLLNLGLLCWQQGDAIATRECMVAAWKLDPNLPEPRIYGSLACLECADMDTARELIADAAHWSYIGPVFEADLATALMNTERFDVAETRLRALSNHPEAEGMARLQLAALLERVNRLDEAEELLAANTDSAEDREERLVIGAALAARRGRHEEAANQYRQALAGSEGSSSRTPQWFALAKACDAIGDSSGAMQALTTAHALQMRLATRLRPHLADSGSEPLSITQHPVEPSAYGRWQEDAQAPDAAHSPIFIVGFSRSGTTLLEQMLDAHPGLHAMDERAFLQDVIEDMQGSLGIAYPDELERLKPADVERLRSVYWHRTEAIVKLAPGERLVDKNPLNMLRLPMIHRMFPQARIVLALRHPCDVILSNYMQSFRAPEYQILCSSIERLAKGYVNAMNFWIRHAELFRPDVVELRYEDLLDDVVAQTRRIAAHLDLSDAATLERFYEHARAKGYISTPSYAQVVEPLNKKAVGRWQRYREYFEPVLPILQPLMERWNYSA